MLHYVCICIFYILKKHIDTTYTKGAITLGTIMWIMSIDLKDCKYFVKFKRVSLLGASFKNNKIQKFMP